MADHAGLKTVAYVLMAFGNPYGDPWQATTVHEALNQLAALGIKTVSLADTVSLAGPDLISTLFRSSRTAYPDCDIGVHLHSAPAQTESNVRAAYNAGCRRFDPAIG